MVSVNGPLSRFETKFLCVRAALSLGSWQDDWQVVWCQPGRGGLLWHVMPVRVRIEFRGCCE